MSPLAIDERKRGGASQADDDQHERAAQRQKQEDRQRRDDERPPGRSQACGQSFTATSHARAHAGHRSSRGERALERGNGGLLEPQPRGLGAQAHRGRGDPERGGDALLRESLRRAGRRPPSPGRSAGRAGRREGEDRPRRRRRRRGRRPRPRPVPAADFARSTASRARTNAGPRAARMSAGRGDSKAPTPMPTLHRPSRSSARPTCEGGRGAVGQRLQFVAGVALHGKGEPVGADLFDERDAFGDEVCAGAAVALVCGDDEHLPSRASADKHYSFIRANNVMRLNRCCIWQIMPPR